MPTQFDDKLTDKIVLALTTRINSDTMMIDNLRRECNLLQELLAANIYTKMLCPFVAKRLESTFDMQSKMSTHLLQNVYYCKVLLNQVQKAITTSKDDSINKASGF